MKPHHLDEYIKEIQTKRYPSTQMELERYVLLIFEEIKRVDEAHESLSDWVHNYED